MSRPAGRSFRRPINCLVVEAHFNRRLDDGEIRRNVEIARTVKRAVADVIDLPPCLRAFDALDRRQYWISDGAKRPRDERRADEFGRIAGAERDHAPTKT